MSERAIADPQSAATQPQFADARQQPDDAIDERVPRAARVNAKRSLWTRRRRGSLVQWATGTQGRVLGQQCRVAPATQSTAGHHGNVTNKYLRYRIYLVIQRARPCPPAAQSDTACRIVELASAFGDNGEPAAAKLFSPVGLTLANSRVIDPEAKFFRLIVRCATKRHGLSHPSASIHSDKKPHPRRPTMPRRTQTKTMPPILPTGTRPEDIHADLGPYPSDLAYLGDELTWVGCRANRLSADRMVAEHGGGEPEEPWDRNNREPVDMAALKRRARGLMRQELSVRTAIDARLALTRNLHATGAGSELALDRLCRLHSLDAFERTVLILAAAPGFSTRFEQVWEQISGDRHCGLNVEVLLGFGDIAFAERIDRRRSFVPQAAMVAGDLVQVGQHKRLPGPQEFLQMSIELTHWCFSTLVGRDGLADDFIEFSALEQPRARLQDVVLPPSDRQRLLSVVDRHSEYLRFRKEWGIDDVVQYGRGVMMLLYGSPGTGKTMTAHALAHHLGKRVLSVDVPTLVEARDSERFLPGLFREARQHDALLFFDECEVLFGSRLHGNTLMTQLLTELERFEGVAVLATNLPQMLDEALDRRVLVKVKFGEPDAASRLEIWRHHLPSGVPLAPDVDLVALADRFELAGGYIKNAVLMAVADAVHTQPDRPVIGHKMLERAARDQLHRPSLEKDELVYPKVRLSDVVLADGALAMVSEVVSAARHRNLVLQRWGIGAHLSYGKGVVALLVGPPGTGKTLCAHAMAAELERPLRVVQAGSLRSKWVGETERNIDNLFREARADNAVVLIDEADGFLPDRDKTTQAHEVHEINALLVALEQHDGVVILATNRAAGLDKALARRIGWTVYLGKPDVRQRVRIWQGLLPPTVPLRTRLDLGGLAMRYPLTGGQIKNAVLKAALRAAMGDGLLDQTQLEAAAMEEGGNAEATIGVACD
ncbi:MAG: AAA family ATPase [Myxococcales bacterium]|nr:AAA family ATPase [Myxococcales bacterium]